MTWTTPADLRAQVQKLWDKGDLLRPCVQGSAMQPQRLRVVQGVDPNRIGHRALAQHPVTKFTQHYAVARRGVC